MNVPDSPTFPVLVVDDEAEILQGLRLALLSGGINNIIPCGHGERVMALIEEHNVGVVLLDLWMPVISGQELLKTITDDHPEVPVVVITGLNEVDTAVECMKSGAFDYLVKPVEKDRLVNVVSRAVEMRELRRENERLKHRVLSSALEHPDAFDQVVTQHPTMLSVFRYLEAVATTRQPVLITGETGVGKELVARAIHTVSGLDGPFVAVNSAGLDDDVFADTLFGHKKGAFTGAAEARGGMIEQATGGTLFLDEIGDLSISSQVKLLRLVQERQFFPLGSDVPKRMSARIVVATNQDLETRQEQGSFRKDLFYRLRTHRVHIPPLRERIEDLPVLVDHLFEKVAFELNKKKPTAPKELHTILVNYGFPGNVRELQAMIFDAVANHRSGVLSLESFLVATGQVTTSIRMGHPENPRARSPEISFSDRLPTLQEAEDLLIAEAMERAKGNQTIAARFLGITRQALNRRLSRTKER
ncbi:sigma-54-dependent transcriptional regulator [Myxococcota bacterium]